MLMLRERSQLEELDVLRGPRPLVLVPTMGALHEGHLSLVRQAAELGPVVVSIFVNPTQFGPGEDFDSYPRDLQSDCDLLAPLEVAAVFAPAVEEMYGSPDGVMVQPGHRARGLCGAGRPGHFSGVLTVVAKLFGLVQPDIAVFGRKDAQQCLVIRQMVEDLCLPVRLIDGLTVREPDGLAMSSRNRYLNSAERKQALCLSRALKTGEDLLRQGERRREVVEAAMAAILAEADRADYAVVRQVPDLETPSAMAGMTLLAVAGKVGPARLIDNNVWHITPEGLEPGCLLGTGKE
jgi:pantoate--beta-alanine ligase|nr:pantoate--beta-alanine ligase [Candidatus Krumholzibacteria bacterium]